MLVDLIADVADDFMLHPSGTVVVWRAGWRDELERFVIFPERDGLFVYRVEDEEGVVFRGVPSSEITVLKVLEEWVHNVQVH